MSTLVAPAAVPRAAMPAPRTAAPVPATARAAAPATAASHSLLRLTPNQLSDFQRNGFLVVRSLFSPQQVTAYRTHLHKWLIDHASFQEHELLDLATPQTHQSQPSRRVPMVAAALDRQSAPKGVGKGKERANPWASVGSTFGGFVEMFYGQAKELVWSSEVFDEAWTDVLSVYANGEHGPDGFQHCEGSFNPQPKHLYPDRACVRQPDSAGGTQYGTGEHVDWHVLVNLYKGPAQGGQPFSHWTMDEGAKALVPERRLDCWRPVQCSVAFSDTRQGEGNFRVAPGWHLKWPAVAAKLQERYSRVGNGDWRRGMHQVGSFKIRQVDSDLCDPILRDFIDVPLMAGDVVFWDTRLPHASADRHCGSTMRVCDFQSRLPDTEQNRLWAQTMSLSTYAGLNHPTFYPQKFKKLEVHDKQPTNTLARSLHGLYPLEDEDKDVADAPTEVVPRKRRWVKKEEK